MNSTFTLIILFSLLCAARASTQLIWTPPVLSQDFLISIQSHRCGNVEFNINFLPPKVTIRENARLIQNFTVTDMMDEAHPMHFKLNGQAKTDSLVIDTF